MELKSTPWAARLGQCAATAVLAFAAFGAQAAIVTQTLTIDVNQQSPSFTNSGPHTIFSLPTSFDQFGLAGTLNSATLSWDLTGTLLMQGDLEGEAVLSYRGESVSQRADTNGNPPNNASFPFSRAGLSLALAGLVGSGDVDLGPLVGTVANVGGLFPWSANLSVLGSITLVYDYTATAPPPNPVPEPSALALAGLGLAGLAMARRKRRRA